MTQLELVFRNLKVAMRLLILIRLPSLVHLTKESQMLIESLFLMGLREQFQTLVDIGIPETQLYRMAGNSVTTNVVTAVATKLAKEIQNLKGEENA